MDFQALVLLFNSIHRSEQSGNYDERAQLRGHSLLQLKTGKCPGSEQIGYRAVDQGDRQIRCRDGSNKTQQHEIAGMQSHLSGSEKGESQNDSGQYGDGSQKAWNRCADVEAK